MNLSRAGASPMGGEDASLVARVQNGDMDAFEELVRRYNRRIYRTLISITGSPTDAEDYTQNVFLKAFRHIGKFQGASQFSTWLTRIAINEGLQRMRRVEKHESLDQSEDEYGEGFRPRQVQAWQENPEQLYSRKELREMVERELMKLPVRYRVAVTLRDLEQLSTQEAAVAMGVGIETLKTRLLRGRLMLREALAPHFKKGESARV